MAGILAWLILIVYIWVGYKTIKRLQTRTAKWIAAAVFALVPTWDIVPGLLYFQYLCSTRSGEAIYKSDPKVEGLLEKNTNYLRYQHLLQTPYAYKFIEAAGKRYYVDSGGNLQSEMIVGQPQSRYAFDGLPQTEQHSMLFNIYMMEFPLKEISTERIIAKQTAFEYAGGWVQRIISSIGTGNPHYQTCPAEFHDHSIFIAKVLGPIR